MPNVRDNNNEKQRHSNEVDNINISIVIPTRDRTKDLNELLITIFNQDFLPFEVIIVDDSKPQLSKENLQRIEDKFNRIGSLFKYIEGSGNGLAYARNIGVNNSTGDAVLFLDDDILLENNVLSTINSFFGNHSEAIGVQVDIISPDSSHTSLFTRFGNVFNKLFLLPSFEPNKLSVHRSGISIFPRPLTKVIKAQRLSGCCSCYRRHIFSKLMFDENLKKWSFMEDVDFSFRIYTKYQNSLFAVPYASVFHKGAPQGRLTKKSQISMSIIYWFYVFFKDIFQASAVNLAAFLWSLSGNLIFNVGELIVKKAPKQKWLNLVYLLRAYGSGLANLRKILAGQLEFFNRTLCI